MNFSNQASLKYNNNIINSNTVNGMITQGITMKKSSRTDNYKPDSEIFYTITIENNSNVTYSTMKLTDNLGRYVWNGLTRFLLEYIPGSHEFLLSDSNGLTKKIIAVLENDDGISMFFDIPANSTIIISYIAKPTVFALFNQGTNIQNFAVLQYYGEGSTFDPVYSDYTILAADFTDVRVSKTLDNQTVTVGQPLTYTFNILNYGNIAATPEISDVLSPNLVNISVYGNGVLWTEGVEYKYETDTGLLTVNENAFIINSARFTTGPIGSRQTVPSSFEIKVTGIVRSLTSLEPYFNVIPAYTDGQENNIEVDRKSTNLRFDITCKDIITAKCQIVTEPYCDLKLTNDGGGLFNLENRILSYGTADRRADRFYNKCEVTAYYGTEEYVINIYAFS